MNFGEIPVDELIRVRGDKNFGRFDGSKYHFNSSGTVYETRTTKYSWYESQ